MAFEYEYARPALAVDCAVFGLDESLKVLLIERGLDPFKGSWALPGGFVEMDESLDQAARRGVVSVGYFALVRLSDHRLQAATDATDARWFDVQKLPKLAFDHAKILKMAKERLQGKVRYGDPDRAG